jgi:predicted aspartyl protease
MRARSPIPGEAEIARAARNLIVIQNVELEFGGKVARADALLDTGATYCVIPDFVAEQLELHQSPKLGTEVIQAVLGRRSTMDRHRTNRMRAGTAQAHDVDVLVGEAVLGLMLIGMSFIGEFTTTLNLDEKRVVFRARTSH